MDEITYTRDHAFAYGKRQLIELITNPDFTPDTYAEYSEDIKSYMKYLKTISRLPNDKQTESVPNTPEDKPVNNEKLLGIFKKNLSGGVIKNKTQLKDGLLFIGETWVRDVGLSDGDLVEILDYDPNQDQASGVRLIEKREPSIPQHIHVFKFGIIENIYDIGLADDLDRKRPYVVRRSVHGDTLTTPYRLTEDEIQRIGISDGDSVDLAWYEHNQKTCRVIWKHKMDYKPSATIEQKRLQRTTDREMTPPSPAIFTDNQFYGLTICLVGMDMYKDKFKQAVEERSGVFIHVDPKTSRVRREADYKRADIILLGLQQISHESSNHAVAFAKQEGILYGSFNGHGVGPFILEIISRLNLTERTG